MVRSSDPGCDEQDELSENVEEQHDHDHGPEDHRGDIAAKSTDQVAGDELQSNEGDRTQECPAPYHGPRLTGLR